MTKRRVIIVGDSHTAAVGQALLNRRKAGVVSAVPFEVHRIGREKPGGRAIDGPTPEMVVESLKAASPADIMISMVGGNQYNVLGMLVHPEPFDFLLEDEGPSLLTPGARVVPLAQLEAAFDHLIGRLGRQVEDFAAAFPGAIRCHFEPPPPKADGDYIRNNAEGYFRTEENLPLQVSPAAFRRRLWVVQSRALARMCARLGLELLTAPPEAIDEQGFLTREAYGPDATHANASYGEMVLRKLETFALAQPVLEAV